MDLKDLSASHRETLFRTLSRQQGGDSDWDQVFALMRRGQMAAEAAELDSLAEQFSEGQALVADELKKGGQFYDWELQFMQLGMATGSLSAIYDRIAAHYRLLEAFMADMRRNLWMPLAIMLALIAGIPAFGWWLGEYNAYEASGNFLLALLPGVLLVILMPLSLLCYRSGWLPLRFWRWVFYLPGIGNLLRRYQTFHYLSHLNLCIAADFSLVQALKQAARRMPPTPVQAKFAGVHRQVQNGEKLSRALQNSGILAGVQMPPLEGGATALDAQIALTRAVYEDCVEQAAFWSRMLPWLLLALIPYVVLINVWSL